MLQRSSSSISHRYDDFVAGIERAPLILTDNPHGYGEGQIRCNGNYFEVTRTIMRVEFAGRRPFGTCQISIPYIREVFSCGHSRETTAGQFNWRNPPKSGCCSKCSDRIPHIEEPWGPEVIEFIIHQLLKGGR